ncbi:MAG TPA: hypothetical protein VG056_04125 [Pirellulales bacterium]|nr:hypothetical protein [Pirellulales bacterium]
MNDDETKLECQLREATGAASSSTAGRDAETAALAEGWLALGQLLEAANSDFGPELVLKQLRRRLLRRRLWQGGALLAATLLIGVSVAWYANRGRVGDTLVTPRNGSDIAVELPASMPSAKADDARTEPTTIADNSSNNSGWDQTLDQRIAQVDDSVVSAGTLANRGDDSIEQLGQQLTSFRQEVEKDSL